MSNGNAAAYSDVKKKVLVVEDDRTHRTLMETILTECGFEVVPAENGVIALCKLDTDAPFDLIVMDWDMPELDGLDTTKAIRRHEVKNNLPHTPVIAFTTHRNHGDKEQCLAAGMDAYLPKDIWMPKWRTTLIDNLQGMIAGEFDAADLDIPDEGNENGAQVFDVEAFDVKALEEVANLLKDELPIAIDEYLEDAASYIRDIQQGLDEKNADMAARGSHPLKSNSKGFGLITVSQIAEAINTHARNGDIDPLSTLVPQLKNAFHTAEKKLHESVKRMGY